MTSPGLHRTKIAQGRIKLMNLLLQNFVKLCLNFRNTSLPLNYIVYVLLLNKSRVFEMLFKFVASSSRMEDLIFSKLTDSTFPKHTILIQYSKTQKKYFPAYKMLNFKVLSKTFLFGMILI